MFSAKGSGQKKQKLKKKLVISCRVSILHVLGILTSGIFERPQLDPMILVEGSIFLKMGYFSAENL